MNIFSPPMQFIRLTSMDNHRRIPVYVNPAMIVEFWEEADLTRVWYLENKTHLWVTESPAEILRLIATTNEVPIVIDRQEKK